MPEDALTPLLFQGISRELQDMLLHSPSPSRKFTDYARHLQELDNRYRQHQQLAPRVRNAAPSSRPITATPAPEVLRRAGSPRPEGKDRRPASPPPTGGEPMDLSAQRKPRFVPGSRRERGECFRYGSISHRIANCPYPDTRPRL